MILKLDRSEVRITLFVLTCLLILSMGAFGWMPDNALGVLKPINGVVMWFSIACVAFCAVNLFNKEKVPGEKEFNNLEYFAMLFSTGMGIGILNYAFQETHMLAQYPDCKSPTGLMISHWSIIPWSLYTAFTIFEVYDMKYNFLGTKMKEIKSFIYGICAMLGIGTSFALGVIAISGTAKYLYGVDIPSYALVVLLGSLVLISILRGLHKGLKLFSNITMYVMYGFILLLIIYHRSDFISVMGEGTKSLFGDFFYNNIYRGSKLQIDWTVFYDIWWICWIPFVSPFAAKVSKGRPIWQIIVMLVIVPSIFVTFFMSLGSSIGDIFYKSGEPLETLQFAPLSVAWFMPVLYIFLMSAFYITSSDSQSLVLDELISAKSKHKKVYRKIGWVLLETLFVTVLLLCGSGTISALQGLSFLFSPLIILLGAVYLYKYSIHVYKNKLVKVKA